MMPKTALRLAASLMVLGSLAACASKPKPEAPVAAAPVQAPPPATTPAPTSPVATAPAPGIRPGSSQDFVVNVGDRVYFDVDQSGIRGDAQSILAAQAEWLKRYPAVKVRIEGNCDERGTREYNFALGARRAQAAVDFLVSHGVTPGRITSISYGKEQPLDNGDGDDAWAKNRNAHTALVEGASQ
ncbi:peptidoglycan-associated lipoprotein Pal [Asticcacaulis solisilvae]